MSAVALEPVLATELWISFVSLVRSYAGVAALHGGQGVAIAATEDSLTLSAGAVACTMQLQPATGAIAWTLLSGATEAAAGRFELLPDGRIEQDGHTHDMDTVAIDMVARVRDRAGKGSRP